MFSFKMKTDKPLAFIKGVINTTHPAPFRQGMWVMHGKQIAILNDQAVDEDTKVVRAEVHYVDNISGITQMAVVVPYSELRQATHDEIPQARKPSKETSQALGYLT